MSLAFYTEKEMKFAGSKLSEKNLNYSERRNKNAGTVFYKIVCLFFFLINEHLALSALHMLVH